MAASRGHVDVAEKLLAAGASLNAKVTRDHTPHYNALHAALFAEGRGGSVEMITYLLMKRVDAGRNADGRLPIHIAFVTGNVDAIHIVRHHMELCGTEAEEFQEDCVDASTGRQWKVQLPLEVGITGGKMTVWQIAMSAAINRSSLRSIMAERPDAVGLFLKRCKARGRDADILYRAGINGSDVALLAKQSVSSCLALLDFATGRPQCENEGWHPVPAQVSFAARSWWDLMWSMVNQGSPHRKLLTFLTQDSRWKFNSIKFDFPKWHEDLTNRQGLFKLVGPLLRH